MPLRGKSSSFGALGNTKAAMGVSDEAVEGHGCLRELHRKFSH